jgi:hypothetical protein
MVNKDGYLPYTARQRTGPGIMHEARSGLGVVRP